MRGRRIRLASETRGFINFAGLYHLRCCIPTNQSHEAGTAIQYELERETGNNCAFNPS